MGLVYKQLIRQIASNKIFVALLLLLTFLTSMSFFFVKISVDGNLNMLNSLSFLTDDQELYQSALRSNAILANRFFASLICLTGFVFLMFFYGFFRSDKKQIGCLKSLGYKDGYLRLFFMLFTALLSTIGSLFGLAGGYVLSGILLQANARTYSVTGLIKGVNASNLLLGLTASTAVFCLVTFFSCFFVSGNEPGVLISSDHRGDRFTKTLWAADRISALIPVKKRFQLRIALRKPIAVFLILAAVMAFTICMILGYSLNISSKKVFASQIIGHNYEFDVHFSDYDTEPVSRHSLKYLDSSALLYVHRQEVKQTMVGIYDLNEIYELQDENGCILPIPATGTVYVNPGLAEIYNIRAGDSLTFAIAGTEHQFTVAIISANAKTASVYVNPDELAEILGVFHGTYNGILGMDKGTEWKKVITKPQRIENLKRNAVSNRISAVINQVTGAVVGAILLFLALFMNFQDNIRDILILNIMGYRIKSIRRLLIDVYLPVLWFFFALSIVPGIMTAQAIQNSLSISTGDYIPFGINVTVIFLVFVLLNFIYCVVKSIFIFFIKNVIAKEEISSYTNL